MHSAAPLLRTSSLNLYESPKKAWLASASMRTMANSSAVLSSFPSDSIYKTRMLSPGAGIYINHLSFGHRILSPKPLDLLEHLFCHGFAKNA